MTRKETTKYVTAFNEYRLLESIGQGGAGTVYKASEIEGGLCAIKIIDPTKTSTQKLKRFQNEISFCQRNTHKNIITILDSGRSSQNEPFYVMPLFDKTLDKAISEGITANEVLRIFGEVLDGVEAAHLQRVTHRDLKPQNILCDKALTKIIVADFGIASFEEEDLYTAVITKDSERLANFQYAAPEQRSRGKNVSSKADIYALGLILNEMFTKEVLQGTGFKTIGSVDASYSYLDELVNLMVRQEPSERPEIREIKTQLLARYNLFLSQQKLDRLTHEVVPESTIDDPLVRDPIRVTGFNYKDGWLLFTLSQTPNPAWIEEFINQTGVTFFSGHEPHEVRFFGQIAHVLPPRGNEPMQAEYFKNWIQNANALYKLRAEKEASAERRRKQQELENQLAAEREKKSIG